MSAPAPAPAHSPAVPGSVTGVFVRLKFALLRNGLRQSSGRTAAFVASLVLVVLLGGLQLVGLILLRGTAEADAVVVPLAALLALGWAFMPLFFSAGDETLDPTRLAVLPLRPRALTPALLSASLVGIGPLFTVLLALGSVIALARGAAGWTAAALALPLLVLTCVALARAVATANTRLLTSRRGRDLAVLSGLIIAVGVQVVNLGVQQLSASGGLGALRPVTSVLRWVPPASAVAAVESASEGRWAAAAGGLLLTCAALAGLLWWWHRSLTRLMTSPDSSTLQPPGGARERTGRSSGGASGASGLLPEGRTGAVMRRTLRYAWRDPKAKVGWASALGLGLLMPFVFSVQGQGTVYNACWVSGLLGLQMYNQFGQDYSGFWMVAQTIDGPRAAYVELRGRLLAVAVVGVPFTTLVVLGSGALLDAWAQVPEALGLALALLGVLLATGVFSSWRFPYSIPAEGQKNVVPGQGSLAYLSILGGMLVGALLCAPLIALTVWLHVAGATGWLWVVLPAGVAYGWAATALSLRVAAPRVADRLPEILTAVSRG